MLNRLASATGRRGLRPTAAPGGGCPGCYHVSLLSTNAKAFTGGKKNKKKGKAGAEGGDASKNAWHIAIMDSPPGPQSQALPDDVRERHREIGRTYNIEYQKQQRAFEGDLHRKIKLKCEAIEALPAELKEEANTIDETLFPITRRLTTWTPPVPGFDAKKYDLPGSS